VRYGSVLPDFDLDSSGIARYAGDPTQDMATARPGWPPRRTHPWRDFTGGVGVRVDVGVDVRVDVAVGVLVLVEVGVEVAVEV
jgi:hypothetical protein